MAHAAFGVFGIAVAAYAGRPADPAAAFVASEDLLHSVAATAMGFAFAAGVVLVAARRAHGEWWNLAFDGLTLAASVAIPLAMAVSDDRAGLAQRVMFAIAFTWYVAATLSRPPEQRRGVRRAPRTGRAAATPSPPTGRSRPPVPPAVDARHLARAGG